MGKVTQAPLFFRVMGVRSPTEEAFRPMFTDIRELRSLCLTTLMVTLTSTAGPTQRRKIIRKISLTLL
ncbi:hypothetical protein CHS0354_029403 [Potamilus streckersoni]|uniref:Uncharacterized protein n=1 Tax=Potamilus streckersoni TaxID=2493646 RepID=A0AAE0SUC0_9BIVA|nr:hypothetical protein CHS0354_029403 [Potamilus streckersoni]